MKCSGCDPPPVKGNLLVDFSGFWNEPISSFEQDENKHNVHRIQKHCIQDT